jgi:hypothetical protein
MGCKVAQGVQGAAMLSQEQRLLLESAVQLEGNLDGVCIGHSMLVL